MSFVRLLLLLLFSVNTQAEETNPNPPQKSAADEVQVYTKESTANVDALNKVTEVLRDPVKVLRPDHEENKTPPAPALTDRRELPRDPTQMSGNFRQALKNMPASNPNGTTPNAANNPPAHTIPAIEVAAKIMGKNKSVMLKINDKRMVQIVEGGKISLLDNQQVITLRVDKIAKTHVKISILPYNEHLILQ